MLVVSAICSISFEQRRTCSIAAAKPVTWVASVPTRSSSVVICPREDCIWAVPCPRRSIARADSSRASSLASATLRWSFSSSWTVPCNSICSARSTLEVSITAWTIPATSEHPTVTFPQASGIRSRALAPAVSTASNSIVDPHAQRRLCARSRGRGCTLGVVMKSLTSLPSWRRTT